MTRTTPDNRGAPLSLTPAQEVLFRSFADRIPLIPRRRRWGCLRQQLGAEVVEQEARIAVIHAARCHNPRRWPDVPFAVRAERHVRGRLSLRQRGVLLKANVWREMPTAEDGWTPEPPDHRGAFDPADRRRLRAWFDPDYTEQRGCLNWTERLVLFLRYVENWKFPAIGVCFAVTGSAAKLIEEEAGRKLAAYRVARRRFGRLLYKGEVAP